MVYLRHVVILVSRPDFCLVLEHESCGMIYVVYLHLAGHLAIQPCERRASLGDQMVRFVQRVVGQWWNRVGGAISDSVQIALKAPLNCSGLVQRGVSEWRQMNNGPLTNVVAVVPAQTVP